MGGHLNENKGGHSFEFLRTIMQEKTEFVDVSSRDEAGIIKTLKQYGPALVSQFEVDDDFHSGKKKFITESDVASMKDFTPCYWSAFDMKARRFCTSSKTGGNTNPLLKSMQNICKNVSQNCGLSRR